MAEEKEKCPFCGMYPKLDQVPGQIDYQCNTIIVDDFPDLPQFGKDCLLRQVSHLSSGLGEVLDQIAALKSILDEAEDIVAEKAYEYYQSRKLGKDIFRCAECHAVKDEPHLSENCGVKLAAALLPRIRKALGELP